MITNDKLAPCLIIIFGASGDLTKRKLIPALYDLFVNKQTPERFAILGVSRTKMSDEDFRQKQLYDMAKENALNFEEASWVEFAKRIHYHAGDSTVAADYDGLKTRVFELQQKYELGENVLFYLSMAPQLYDKTIENIGGQGMVVEGKAWCSINRMTRPWQRIIIEKPFGNDPKSAAHLNRVLGRVFEEDAIYRIDHYLGKETVQNLMVFRFANSIFEPIWNRQYIDHVQVTATETVGVESRGGYYDSGSGGAMRDMIQSHLLQVMAVVAMEPPVSLRADDVRLEKSKVLTAVRDYTEEQIPSIAVRGQYGPGSVKGKNLPAYRSEPGVKPDSQTDTFSAIQLYLDTWRWDGVPFYVRSGKAMAKKLTEVVIYFKQTPHSIFRNLKNPTSGKPLAPNQIVINIQPDEGIKLRFEGKVPGTGMKIKSVEMDFDYVKEFQTEPPQAYSTLILDAMRGDQTLYKHKDEIERAWQIVQPVLDYWDANPAHNLPNYSAGTWGPAASDALLELDGRHWHNP
jgi:glucose-6-phosphate 1-dehydrogenase